MSKYAERPAFQPRRLMIAPAAAACKRVLVGIGALAMSDGAEVRRLIQTKLALAAGWRQWREHLGLTQTEVANCPGSSKSRVAKMEAADTTVTTNLLLRSLYRPGAG